MQMGISTIIVAEAQKNARFYIEEIASCPGAQIYSSDVNLYMMIAYLCNEKLNDTIKAINYFRLFLDK
jgi:hypothetical protein